MPGHKCQCRKHRSYFHQCFISYRVASDADRSFRLWSHLDGELLENSTKIIPFRDEQCLPLGERWQKIYIEVLVSGQIAVLLISAQGLQKCYNADHEEDHLLLEFETALRLYEEEKIHVLPLLIGNNDGTAFQLPNIDSFPDRLPLSPANLPASFARTNIRTTMRKLFDLHGMHIPHNYDMRDLVPNIARILNHANSPNSKFDQVTAVLKAMVLGFNHYGPQGIQAFFHQTHLDFVSMSLSSAVTGGNFVLHAPSMGIGLIAHGLFDSYEAYQDYQRNGDIGLRNYVLPYLAFGAVAGVSIAMLYPGFSFAIIGWKVIGMTSTVTGEVAFIYVKRCLRPLS